nr:MAG: hypothetical protein [Porcellio scaber clopovirus]
MDELQRRSQYFVTVQTETPIFKSMLIVIGFYCLVISLFQIIFLMFFDNKYDSFKGNNKINETTLKDIQNLNLIDKIKLFFSTESLNTLDFKNNNNHNKSEIDHETTNEKEQEI